VLLPSTRYPFTALNRQTGRFSKPHTAARHHHHHLDSHIAAPHKTTKYSIFLGSIKRPIAPVAMSSQPQSSIPGYRPGPILRSVLSDRETSPSVSLTCNLSNSRNKKLFLASLVFIPTASYIWLKRLETKSKQETRLLEEEGRRSWIQSEKERLSAKDLSVAVGRSGGGI
jgi:hypothetical protein